MQERERVDLIIKATRDTKAEDVVLVDMDNRSPLTDYVLICSGRSQAHVRGIAERIETDMKQAGFRCAAMEGLQEGSWVLMDYDVLLVHVFHPETRSYYDLEGLLRDYPTEHISQDAPDPGPGDGRTTSAA